MMIGVEEMWKILIYHSFVYKWIIFLTTIEDYELKIDGTCHRRTIDFFLIDCSVWS